MSSVIPVNLTTLFQARLSEMRRPPDGLLHASSDLVGSLRHSQLRAAGAPETPTELADDVVLMTGTMWHAWAHEALVAAGLPFMQEVKLSPWLPEGWSGTADWIFFDPDSAAFVLGDMKTIKGDGVAWIARDGAKMEHQWQLSAYWHALYDMGLPLLEGFGVLYWPKDRGTRGGEIRPIIQDVKPLPREVVHERMDSRWQATKQYIDEVENVLMDAKVFSPKPEHFLNGYLAPTQDRIQKLTWVKPTGVFDLKLEPHWSAAYCPFPSELCGCREQGKTKIGFYDLDGKYHPRKGWEDVEPTVAPSSSDIRKRQKETE